MSFLADLPPAGFMRTARIVGAIVNGRLDAPKCWHEVHVDGREVLVSARYLTIGGETIPMTADVAQLAVDSLGASLPTVAVVEAIERVPGAVLAHLPTQKADGGETSTAAFVRCEAATVAMLAGLDLHEGSLVAGYRKDVVQPAPAGKVAIYGARWADSGKRIQDLSVRHGLFYSDYSTGIRAVRGLVTAWRYPLPW